MRILELFSGTGNLSRIAELREHETLTIDLYEKADVQKDLLKMIPEELFSLIDDADVVWMSPPCQTLSMASGNTHWNERREPRTAKGREAQKIMELCKDIAEYCVLTDKKFFIENPRARARWFLPERWRKTVTYCQYGENRMKPTDIWTNCKEWKPRPMCKKGSPCHEPAPRGSKTGTQGLKTAKIRGRLPDDLCIEVIEACEKWQQLGEKG